MANPAFLLDLQHSNYFTRVEINHDGPTVIVQSRRIGSTDNVLLSQRDALALAHAILANAGQEAA